MAVEEKNYQDVTRELDDLGICFRASSPLGCPNPHFVIPSTWDSIKMLEVMRLLERALNKWGHIVRSDLALSLKLLHERLSAECGRGAMGLARIAELERQLDAIQKEKEALMCNNAQLQKMLQVNVGPETQHDVDFVLHVSRLLDAMKRERACLGIERDSLMKASDKLLNDKFELQCQLATISERCKHACSANEDLRAETIRLRGEKDDLISRILLSSRIEASSAMVTPQAAKVFCEHRSAGRCELDMSDNESWMKVPSQESCSDKASSISRYSLISVCSSEEFCFKSDAVFKIVTNEGIQLAFASKLKKGNLVLAADGKTHMKIAGEPQPHKTNRIVQLCAGTASLQVTRDHRVPILDSIRNEPREAKAIELQRGNVLFVDGLPQKLWHIEEHVLEHEVEVVKIVFTPDLPVGVFTVPATIQSHGSKKKTTRRGGMTKGHRQESPEGALQLLHPRSAATLSDCED
eukprot:TRINITY_DN19773_c0_g1_i2.p1 TRINITY_DN19773_c0_g1~~TRINITY_DN19773_c0_g1_i2.p1  ORF type:complete len:466 (-),score=81.84 TRINITY_DN19773_c0_g1_i2:323-1720(-)